LIGEKKQKNDTSPKDYFSFQYNTSQYQNDDNGQWHGQKTQKLGKVEEHGGIVYFGKIRKLFKIRKRKFERYLPL
jgi:hypothetical protein